MRKTNYSLTNKDVLVKIPFINQNGLDNLCNSGRLNRKKILGVWKYDSYSVDSLKKQFNTDEYISYTQTKTMLEENGIKDIFMRYSNRFDDVNKCKYQRITKQFPMSVKNLIKYKYLDVDIDISPIMIKRSSVIKTIKHFSSVKNNQIKQTSVSKAKELQIQPKPSNNSDYYKLLLSDLMEELG